MTDSASVSSFSSLDNVSRSSMLRRQREAALRRHQNSDAPLRNDRPRAPSSLSTTMTDIMSETVLEEEDRRRRLRIEEDRRRAKELEQLELKRRLAEEQAAREKERLATKAAKSEQAALEERARVLAAVEAERAKFVAERQRLAKQHAQMLGQYQGAGDASLKRSDTHPSSGSDNAEEAYGQVSSDMAGGNNGYQRYLSTFHQPVEGADGQARGETKEDATIISELTDGYSPRESVQAERNACIPTSNNADGKGSKMKRSMSTRSLSFNELNEADESAEQTSSAVRPGPKRDGVSEESSPSRDEASNSIAPKQIVTIDSANFDDPNVMRSFLMQPCPKGEGMVQCCVRRNKGIKNALFPEYRIYLKNSRCTETFLMTSKKRVGNKTSNYLISMSRNDHDKKSDSILGKLRSNFLGTEYMIYDHGNNPDYEESYYDEAGDIRCELGAILYAANTSLGSKGPRKMRVCIPKADDGGKPANVWQPTEKDDERMIACFKKETDNIDKLECLENKPPSWNEEVGAYVLNFNGRVTQASVKNFQLCKKADSEQEQIMQFGRTGKDEFSLDVSWPMSLFQAFAVALSSFDSKLGCD